MEYVEAPDIWPGVIRPNGAQTALFLAGGITNCPDWQQEARKPEYWSGPNEHVVLLNPRRAKFPMGDTDAGRTQIRWEALHLQHADAVLFWFPKETLCPITLFELGSMLRTSKPLFIGTDWNYERRFDVVEQTEIKRPGMTIYASLDALLSHAAKEVQSGEFKTWMPATKSSLAQHAF